MYPVVPTKIPLGVLRTDFPVELGVLEYVRDYIRSCSGPVNKGSRRNLRESKYSPISELALNEVLPGMADLIELPDQIAYLEAYDFQAKEPVMLIAVTQHFNFSFPCSSTEGNLLRKTLGEICRPSLAISEGTLPYTAEMGGKAEFRPDGGLQSQRLPEMMVIHNLVTGGLYLTPVVSSRVHLALSFSIRAPKGT